MHEEKIVVKRGSFGSTFSGFVIGGLIGAAIALLSAPKAGVETRQILREKSSQLRDRAVESAQDYRGKASEVISNARGRVEEIASTTRQKAADVLHRESDMLHEGAHQVERAADKTERGNI